MATKIAQNGTAEKTATKKAVSAQKKEENPVIKMPDLALQKMVEFQQTIDRVNDLQKLVENYTLVSETLKSIAQFKGGTGESIQFALHDYTNNNEFATYNTNLITMVVDVVTSKLNEKKQELVENILGFNL